MQNSTSENKIVGGTYFIDQVRDGKVIDRWSIHNLVPNEGLNAILGVMFSSTSKISSWYIAPFEGNYNPSAGDTAATIVASATESTAYNETSRALYSTAAPSAQSVTNAASKATFTFNAAKTLYGVFMSSASAKSAKTGVLMSVSKFDTPRTVASGDQLQVTYVFNAASA